jgi:hypothetical protein
MPSLVLIVDFDKSLIPLDSDALVAEKLGRAAVLDAGGRRWLGGVADRSFKPTWPQVVTEAFSPFSRAALRSTAASTLLMDEGMANLLRTLVLLRDGNPSLVSGGACHYDAVDFFVVSGSNEAFIEGCLEATLGSELFSIFVRRANWLHTNRVVDSADGKSCRIEPYNVDGHECEPCRTQGYCMMCKGAIVDDIRRHYASKCPDASIVFVGDGLNDHCVLRRLAARDVFCVRDAHALHKELVRPSLQRVVLGPKPAWVLSWDRTVLGVCTVLPWATYDVLVAAVRYLLFAPSTAKADRRRLGDGADEDASTTPSDVFDEALSSDVMQRLQRARRVLQAPLQLFGEDPLSFRAVTVTHRMPETVLHTLKALRREKAIDDVTASRIEALAATVAQQPLNPLVPCAGPYDHVTHQTALPVVQGPYLQQDRQLSPDELYERSQQLFSDLHALAASPLLSPDSANATHESFWLQAALLAAKVSALRSSLASFTAKHGLISSRTHAKAATVHALRQGTVHWNDLPWLQGEMLFHRLIQIVYASHDAPAPPPACTEDVGAADHCAACNAAQGGRLGSDTACNGCAYDLEGHRATVAPAWDFYRFEKAESLASTGSSHVIPAVAALYGELQVVLHDIRAGGVGRSSEEVMRTRAVPLLHAALLNCTWGNCIDLSLHRSTEVGTVGHTSSPSAAEAERTFAEAYQQLQAKEGLLADGTMDMAERLARLILASNSEDEDERRDGDDVGLAPRVLDIVLDNAGVEVSADLVLAVIVAELHAACDKTRSTVSVCLHCKALPFYVSDVVPHDVGLALTAMRSSGNRVGAAFADACTALLDARRVTVRPSVLWSSARELREHGVELFDRFFEYVTVAQRTNAADVETAVVAKTRMVLLKGDLNFRRVVGDRHWNAVDAADWREVVESYWPLAPLRAFAGPREVGVENSGTPGISVGVLRTCKCELVCGVSPDVVARLDSAHEATRPSQPQHPPTMGTVTEEERRWVKSGWRVNGTRAVALLYP